MRLSRNVADKCAILGLPFNRLGVPRNKVSKKKWKDEKLSLVPIRCGLFIDSVVRSVKTQRRTCTTFFALGFQTPPDRRAVMTVTTDGYETRFTLDTLCLSATAGR